MSEWISVKDRLPETNDHKYKVLVFIPERERCRQSGIYTATMKPVPADDGSGNFWGLRREECDWTVWGWCYFENPIVTHWMPMPEPPEEE